MRKKALFTLTLALPFSLVFAQQKPGAPPAPSTPAAAASGRNGAGAQKQEPKSYKEVITDKAISRTGLFTVHRIEDKWYFEIPDSILGRDVLVSTRYSKTAASNNY